MENKTNKKNFMLNIFFLYNFYIRNFDFEYYTFITFVYNMFGYRSRPHGGGVSTAATTAHNTLNSHATHTLNSHTLNSHHSHTLSSAHGGQPDILKSTPDHQRIKWIENILKQWIWVIGYQWVSRNDDRHFTLTHHATCWLE